MEIFHDDFECTPSNPSYCITFILLLQANFIETESQLHFRIGA